jgi:sensor histidine kinase YesM
MLSQIQPHFIYNTLTTIQVLCEIDPAKAVKTIESFTKYLRMNTDALSKKEPVPVLEEVKHRMAYADIEMVRFDNVKVLFAIKDKDFNLPVLTIEPILENSIKYGVRARKEGKVEVTTYKEGNKHVLVVKDNGVGFDMDKVKADGKEHVGINNVKTRIINMVHGTFDVWSALNKGTIVTITIPEEKS